MKKILFLILGCMFVADNSANAMEQKQQAAANVHRKKLTIVRPGQRVAEVAQAPVLPIVQQTPIERPLVVQPATIVEKMSAAEPVSTIEAEATAPVEVTQSQEPSVNAMVNRDGTLLELIYTKHARERMEKRNVSELDIELAIEYGKTFLDTKTNSIVYRVKIKRSEFNVVTQPMSLSNKIVIITVFYEFEEEANREVQDTAQLITKTRKAREKTREERTLAKILARESRYDEIRALEISKKKERKHGIILDWKKNREEDPTKIK